MHECSLEEEKKKKRKSVLNGLIVKKAILSFLLPHSHRALKDIVYVDLLDISIHFFSLFFFFLVNCRMYTSNALSLLEQNQEKRKTRECVGKNNQSVDYSTKSYRRS